MTSHTGTDVETYAVEARSSLLAEFSTLEELVAAVHRVRETGYRRFDAFCPYPSEELDEALGPGRTAVPAVILIFGIIGGLSGYFLQYWINLDAYPLNIGGRPLHSWPAFIPPTFECTVLAASFAALIGMLLLNGLPRPNHALFEIPRFAERASLDSYFLCLEADDPLFDPHASRRLLISAGATEVWDVAG